MSGLIDRCVRKKEAFLSIWKVGLTVNTNRDLKRSKFWGKIKSLVSTY